MSTETIREITVALGERSYPIRIGQGLLETVGPALHALRPGARCAIVTDENVDRLHGDRLRAALAASGFQPKTVTVEPGERSKSVQTLETVLEELLSDRLERRDIVIAFGGGVVGDLAGFAAAIARRGMDFMQIPTSLLAQVDSSVGGKTGVNTRQGKNLVGAFHQPVLVLADIALLDTLPKREFRAGYAEIAKYGLIDRPDFFGWLERTWPQIHNRGPALADAIATSCEAKASIVAADEREGGRRALLNLGHTFAHALEAVVEYDSERLVHGEAVAIGLVLAHEFSNRLNLCDADSVTRVRNHLAECGLPVSLAQIPGELPDADGLTGLVAQDKKVQQGRLTFILTKGIGKAYIAQDVPSDAVRAFWKDKLQK